MIPAHDDFQMLYVTALEDNTPRWTETVDYTLAPAGGGASDCTLATDASAAGCYVTNDDLYAWLGDGSDNAILEGDGGDYTAGESLTPLVLDLPQELRDGAQVTLTDDAPDNANVWMDASPGEGEQPVLGVVDGTTISQVAWTYGTDSDAPSGLATLWVEATDGSADLNAIHFDVRDDDSGATAPSLPQYSASSPLSPPPPPAPTTDNSGASNNAAAVSVGILMYNDPNGSGDYGKDIQGKTHDYLVGQLVDLVTSINGPPSMTRFAVNFWSVTGNVAHNILEAGDASSRQVIPLLDDNGNGLVGGQHASQIGAGSSSLTATGLWRREVNFFWISATSPSENDTVHLQVTFPNGMSQFADATFDVYTPNWNTGVAFGAPEIFYQSGPNSQNNPDQWKVGLGPTPESRLLSGGYEAGIVWFANVHTPQSSSFAPGLGHFRFVQTVELLRSYTRLVPPDAPGATRFTYAKWQHTSLDTSDPYGGYTWYGPQSDYPFSGVGWPTDSAIGGSSNDTPGKGIDAATDYSVSLNDSFQTYLMYLPQGAGSQWVPLAMVPWHYSITVVRTPSGGWTHSFVSSSANPQFSTITTEPEWTQRLTGAEIDRELGA